MIDTYLLYVIINRPVGLSDIPAYQVCPEPALYLKIIEDNR